MATKPTIYMQGDFTREDLLAVAAHLDDIHQMFSGDPKQRELKLEVRSLVEANCQRLFGED